MKMSSTKIRGGEVFLVALPIRRPHHWVGHTARIGEGYAVLRLELESGIIGWGEAQVIGTWGGDYGARYGETPKMTAIAIKEPSDMTAKALDELAYEIGGLYNSLAKAYFG